MSGGGGSEEQTVSNEPWQGVRKYLTDLYARAATQSQQDMTPLQAQPIDQRLRNITQMWGGNPAEIAQQYGMGAGMLSQAPALRPGGALTNPNPPPTPSLQPPAQQPITQQQLQANNREQQQLMLDGFIRPEGMGASQAAHWSRIYGPGGAVIR